MEHLFSKLYYTNIYTAIFCQLNYFLLSRLVITFLPRSKRLLISWLQSPSANITVIQVYAPTSNTEEAEVEWFYEDL